MTIDRYIKLITDDALDIAVVKTWFRCVTQYAPSGIVRTVTVNDDSGSPRSVSLVHSETDKHHYVVPLSRDLSEEEVEDVVENFSEQEPDLDFDVEINTARLAIKDYPDISLDATRHLELCVALAKQKHEDWLRERTDAGWRYGTEFDADEKTHPLIRPWDQLPDRYKKPDMNWPQKLIAMLDDQGYAVIPKDSLDKLTKKLRK